MLDGAGAFDLPAAQGRGAPTGTPAVNSCPQFPQFPLRSFCWESCKTEVALLRCTGTRGTCCFSQCRRMQAGSAKGPRKLHVQQGSRTSLPSAASFPFIRHTLQGESTAQIFYFSLRKKKNPKQHHHNKPSSWDERDRQTWHKPRFCSVVNMQRGSKFFAKKGSSLGRSKRSLTSRSYEPLSLCQSLFHRELLLLKVLMSRC